MGQSRSRKEFWELVHLLLLLGDGVILIRVDLPTSVKPLWEAFLGMSKEMCPKRFPNLHGHVAII